MAAFGRLLRLILGLWVLGFAGSLIGAAVSKGRLASKGGSTDDEFDLVAIFEPLEFASTAPALRRASVLAWYGGGTVDLRGVTLDAGGASLDLKAIFGGIRLVVPEAWRVEHSTVGIFGGIGDGRDPDRVSPDGPTLHLTGFAIFGGAGVISDAPDLHAVTTAAA